MVLVRELVAGSTRFNDLRRVVSRMSPTLLSKRLTELEDAGIVRRAPIEGSPGHLGYELTEAGRDPAPVVEAVACGARNGSKQSQASAISIPAS